MRFPNYWTVPKSARYGASGGMPRLISSSHTVAAISDGARQSPRGDNDPPCDTFGPFGIADLLNWLNEK